MVNDFLTIYRASYNFSILKLFKEGTEAQEASDIQIYTYINYG